MENKEMISTSCIFIGGVQLKGKKGGRGGSRFQCTETRPRRASYIANGGPCSREKSKKEEEILL